jgi:hypothetical protein
MMSPQGLVCILFYSFTGILCNSESRFRIMFYRTYGGNPLTLTIQLYIIVKVEKSKIS